MRYIIILIALVALTGFISCTKENQPYASPETTVKTFAAKMAEGDYEGAMACYNEESTISIGEDISGLTDDELRTLFLKSLENSSAPYTENEPENIRMTSAIVTYELDGGTHEHHLVVEDGEWKINISGNAPLPAGGFSPGESGQ